MTEPQSILDLVCACHGDCRKCPPTCPILDGKEPPEEATQAASQIVYVPGDEEFADCPSGGCSVCQRDPQNCPMLDQE